MSARRTIAGYRRMSLAEKERSTRPAPPLLGKCLKCGVKISARDRLSHADRHGIPCGWMPERRVCPRCGRDWWTFAGTSLNMHARCRFSVEEGDAIFDRYAADPTLTIAKLAANLNVGDNVVRVVLAAAQRRKVFAARPEVRWRCRLCGDEVLSRDQAGHTAREHAGASHGWDMVTS
jgi:hypothetical protein